MELKRILNAYDPEGYVREMRKAGLAALAIVSALGLYLNIRLWFGAGHGGVDFNQFYSAARLAGTGHLYDWDSLRALEAEHGPPIHSGRLPVVTFGLKPLTLLPYIDALWLWRIASVGALLVACVVWPGTKWWLLAAGFCWSACATYTIALGQDAVFWLMWFALGLALLQRGHPRLAGVIFAMCICKYHLAVALPVLLISQKQWKTVIAGAWTGAVLLAASFVIEGTGWPREYIRTVSQPEFSPGVEYMANLNGLVSWLPGPHWLELGAAALVLLTLLFLVSGRGAIPGFAGAAAAACGLLLGQHGYVGDCVLLVPLAILVLQSGAFPLLLRCWAGLLTTPALMFLVVSPAPYIGQSIVAGFVMAVMYWVLRRGTVKESGVEPEQEAGWVPATAGDHFCAWGVVRRR